MEVGDFIGTHGYCIIATTNNCSHISVVTKNVVISLFSGTYFGVLLLVGGRPLEATMETIGNYLFPQVADSYNAAVLVLLFFIGGFVALMEKSGGGAALAEKATNFINTRVKAQLAAWFGGVLIFFSDIGTPLIVGPYLRRFLIKRKSLERSSLGSLTQHHLQWRF